MNKIFAIFLVLLTSSLSYGQADVKLSKDDFLKRLMDGQISMKKDPLFATAEGDREKIMDILRKKNPAFQDAYWFVPTLRTNSYQYTVFFEWPTRKCLFRVEEIDLQTKGVKPGAVDVNGQSVDVKYCEKAYGIKIN